MQMSKNVIKITSLLLFILVVLTLSSCTSWTNFMQSLNERQIQSCLYYEGYAAGYVRVKGVTATGGVKFSECRGD